MEYGLVLYFKNLELPNMNYKIEITGDYHDDLDDLRDIVNSRKIANALSMIKSYIFMQSVDNPENLDMKTIDRICFNINDIIEMNGILIMD